MFRTMIGTFALACLVFAASPPTSPTAPPNHSYSPMTPPPGPFNLLSPSNGSTGQGTSGTLTWSSSSNTLFYSVYLGTDPQPNWVADTTATSYHYHGLDSNTTYYWGVLAVGNGGSTRSTPFAFHFTTVGVQPPPAPTPVLPTNGSSVNTQSPTFEVQPVDGADGYCFRVYKDGNAIGDFCPSSNSGQWPDTLENGVTYTWSCRAHNAAGYGPFFTPHWSFTVAVLLPAPTPVLPSNGTSVNTQSPTFEVQPADGADGYCFRVYKDGNAIGDFCPSSNSGQWPDSLENGVTYTWSCRAHNSAGYGAFFSPHWSFTVDAPGIAEGTSLDSDCTGFGLREIGPNPFRWSTSIRYGLPRDGSVKLRILNSSGAVVRTLRAGAGQRGMHRVVWDGTDERGERVGKGVYFCSLESGEDKSLMKVVRLE